MTFPLFFFGKCDKFQCGGSLLQSVNRKEVFCPIKKRAPLLLFLVMPSIPPFSFFCPLAPLSLPFFDFTSLSFMFFKTPPHPCVRDHSMQAPFSPSSKTLVCPIVNREVKTLKNQREKRNVTCWLFARDSLTTTVVFPQEEKNRLSLSILIPLLPLSKDSFRNCAFC